MRFRRMLTSIVALASLTLAACGGETAASPSASSAPASSAAVSSKPASAAPASSSSGECFGGASRKQRGSHHKWQDGQNRRGHQPNWDRRAIRPVSKEWHHAGDGRDQ